MMGRMMILAPLAMLGGCAPMDAAPELWRARCQDQRAGLTLPNLSSLRVRHGATVGEAGVTYQALRAISPPSTGIATPVI